MGVELNELNAIDIGSAYTYGAFDVLVCVHKFVSILKKVPPPIFSIVNDPDVVLVYVAVSPFCDIVIVPVPPV